jgi:hypothetical protein
MKRTDKERIERTLKRTQKQQDAVTRKVEGRSGVSAGTYSKDLLELLQFDDEQVYNIDDDEDVLELMLEMKDDLPEAKWEVAIKKAVKATKVREKQVAIDGLMALMTD